MKLMQTLPWVVNTLEIQNLWTYRKLAMDILAHFIPITSKYIQSKTTRYFTALTTKSNQIFIILAV